MTSQNKKFNKLNEGLVLAKATKLMLILLAISLATPSRATGKFSQLVLSFPDKRAIDVSENPSEPSIEIHFAKTGVNELTGINFYDETMIHRLIISDLGPSGSKIKLVLKSNRIKANVSSFSEPFRVAIDLFDDTYKLERDPRTALPLASTDTFGSAVASGATIANRINSDGLIDQIDRSANDLTSAAPSAAQAKSTPLRLMDESQHSASAAPKLDLDGVRDGRGPEWANYPVYIYPIQTALYLARSGAPSVKELTAGQSLAEHGLKLYNFGHELKALEAYKNVMRLSPQVFDTDALHLWAVAEIYFGKGELGLARSYHQTLREKHPDSPLSALSQMRDLDIESIKMSASGRAQELKSLVTKLDQVNNRGNNEIKAQIAIRRQFWSQNKTTAPSIENLPQLAKEVQAELASWWSTLESPRTAYLVASLIANQIRIAEWDKSNSEFVGAYIEKYKEIPANSWVKELKAAYEIKVAVHLQKMLAKGDFLGLIESYESLPKSMQTIYETPATGWAIAEAYRNLAKPDIAINFYKKAAKSNQLKDQFKSLFWLTMLHAETSSNLHRSQRSIESANKDLIESDKSLYETWKRLQNDEKMQLAVAYKIQLESAVTKKLKASSFPLINLELWTRSLSTKADLNSNPDEWTKSWRPSASTVSYLKILSDHFALLGLPNERQRTIELIGRIKPDLLKDDPDAKNIWLDQLIDLAEDHRKANRYLESGRLFAEAARNADQWDKKAEALYKGGLLLYRAGQKNEALTALKQAAEDTNNFFYANLAKERLNQLEK
jgi:tetratricopeptide (TPR) repeat protein